MKKHKTLKILIILILAAGYWFIQGIRPAIDASYEDALESFKESEQLLEELVLNPNHQVATELQRVSSDFYRNYYALLDHQTLFNKVFHIQPLLTDSQVKELERLFDKDRENDKLYVKIVLEELYNANDLQPFLNNAKVEDSSAITDGTITWENSTYEISVNGRINEEFLLSHRYLLLETPEDNYYWEYPNELTSITGDSYKEIRVKKETYIFKMR